MYGITKVFGTTSERLKQVDLTRMRAGRMGRMVRALNPFPFLAVEN